MYGLGAEGAKLEAAHYAQQALHANAHMFLMWAACPACGRHDSRATREVERCTAAARRRKLHRVLIPLFVAFLSFGLGGGLGLLASFSTFTVLGAVCAPLAALVAWFVYRADVSVPVLATPRNVEFVPPEPAPEEPSAPVLGRAASSLQSALVNE